MSNVHIGPDISEGLCADVTPRDLEWTLAASAATETQTFYLKTNEGHFCFVQMIHSNIGVWGPTIQFTARFFGDGINTFKSVNMTNFKLSEDRRSVNADDLDIILNPDCSAYKVSLKHGNELLVDFTFERVDRGFKVGRGKIYLSQDQTAYVGHTFWPKGRVSGSLVVGGRYFDLAGVGLFVHAIQSMRPHTLASRWNFLVFHSDQASLSMMEFETTPTYGSVKVNQGSLVLDDKLAGVSIENAVDLQDLELDEETGYEVPKEFVYSWTGKTLEEDKDYKVTLRIKPQTLMDKIDVLNEMPYVIKKIVQALVAKPYVYQWFNEATAEIKIDGKTTITVKGKLFSECVFIS